MSTTISEPSTFTFSFNQNQSNDYFPTSLEIKKFKNNNELSENFQTKCKDFKKLMDDEIKEFQTKYNNVTLINYPDKIMFYNSNEPYFELTPFYNVPNNISFAEIKFYSSEQIVCFAKAIYANDLVTAFKILIQSKAYYAHNYAKNINECMNWNNIYYPIIYVANYYKFKCESMKNIMNECKEKYLIYNSKYDDKLGSGKDGKGQNVLGVILMMIMNF